MAAEQSEICGQMSKDLRNGLEQMLSFCETIDISDLSVEELQEDI